jgi:hypothetical protein
MSNVMHVHEVSHGSGRIGRVIPSKSSCTVVSIRLRRVRLSVLSLAASLSGQIVTDEDDTWPVKLTEEGIRIGVWLL